MKTTLIIIILLSLSFSVKASWIENCLFKSENLSMSEVEIGKNLLTIKLIESLNLEANHADCKKFIGTELEITLTSADFINSKNSKKLYVEYLNGDCLDSSKECKSYILRTKKYWDKIINDQSTF